MALNKNMKAAINKQETSQSEPIPGKNMAKNNAGGYAFKITPFQRLERFLIIGSEAGTYYVSGKKLSIENAANVQTCLGLDYKKTIDTIVAISDGGRAPKNDPALLALSMACSSTNLDVKRYAAGAVNKVVRTGRMLFQFMEMLKLQRGEGRYVRHLLESWYCSKTPHALALQVVKYRSGNGFTHKDLL